MSREEKVKIRKFIMEQTEPFCIADILNGLSGQGVCDRKQVIEELNEMHADGLIQRRKTDNFEDTWVLCIRIL